MHVAQSPSAGVMCCCTLWEQAQAVPEIWMVVILEGGCT